MKGFKSSSSKEDFAASLRVPEKPASMAEAEAAWQLAVSRREAAQARHIEAVAMYRAQVPGQPLTITLRAVEELAETLGPLFQTEQAAAEVRAAIRVEYDATANALMSDALAKYRDALTDRIAGLEELLGHGIALHSEAAKARVELPSTLPSRCVMIKHAITAARIQLLQAR